MAEARSATSQPKVTLETGLNENALQNFSAASYRSLVRNAFRLRNRVRNNLWPMSLWYTSLMVAIVCAAVMEDTHCPEVILHGFNTARSHLPDWILASSPRSIQVLGLGALLSVVVVLLLGTVRQLGLRMLLSYHGWLCKLSRRP